MTRPSSSSSSYNVNHVEGGGGSGDRGMQQRQQKLKGEESRGLLSGSSSSSSTPTPTSTITSLSATTERRPELSSSSYYGTASNETPHMNESDFSDDDDSDDYLLRKERMLAQSASFDLPYSEERGFRATTYNFFSTKRPYARAMHASSLCLFTSYAVQFAMAPLLPQLQNSLNLTKQDVWSVRFFQSSDCGCDCFKKVCRSCFFIFDR
jgi:hypothetical protein